MNQKTDRKRYFVGVDVGLRSLGLAAIEIDDAGMPVSILNAMSLIHDGGVDPNNEKRADSRKAVSGVARRTRRRYRTRKQRLANLDKFLTAEGYPLVDLKTTPDAAAWEARAALTSGKITDEKELKEKLSLAVRHIARHRGWRNPYTSVESLFVPAPAPSPGFITIREAAQKIIDSPLAADATVAEMVAALDGKTVKLRGKDGLFSERLHQQDLAREIHKMASAQGFSQEFTNRLISEVFFAKSPKGSSKNIGKDPLNPSEDRAPRAVREFQEYRIIALLANIRIVDRSPGTPATRPLSVEERQKCFEFLNSYSKKDRPSWSDVAELLDVDRGDLRGTATATDDGERVSARPPINDTWHTFANSSIKAIKHFWASVSNPTRDALVREFSNVKIGDDESPEAIQASSLLRSLKAEDFAKLENIRLSDGRSAYSEETLEKLTQYMLSNVADLSEARYAVFGVAKDWKPTPPPVDEQTGNPAVDRVLKAFNRWLLMAEHRWGNPEKIVVEVMRKGFKSEKAAREMDRDQDSRAQRNREMLESMTTSLGLSGTPRRSELNRYLALQRQNGQCAYCGTSIDFKTMELDHIVPRAGVGSTNKRSNLLAACGRCNREKMNLPFAVWAKQTSIPGVSVEAGSSPV